LAAHLRHVEEIFDQRRGTLNVSYWRPSLFEAGQRTHDDPVNYEFQRSCNPSKLFKGKTHMVPSIQKTIAATLLSACLVIAVPAFAETIAFKADLKAANEVPPNTSAATGTAEATFDTVTKTLTWTVTYQGLSGPAIGAHFHGPGEHGKNAGIVVPFNFVATPIKGTAMLSDAQAADLMAGKWYANIHTAANPGGEIRGQMAR
jgi:hypothetical protein